MNVIGIMADSLRKDHLGCYGNNWIKTPNIDKLASNGTIFDHAYAEGLPTIPVRTALFTGRYTLPFRTWQPLERCDIPIAEILWNKGYVSALISDTYHMHKPQMDFSRGFDYVQWIRGQECDPYITDTNIRVSLLRKKFSEKNWRLTGLEELDQLAEPGFEQYLRNTAHWKGEEDHFVAQVVRAGVSWLERQVHNGGKNRFFLWLDSFDPHEPWDPPSPYKEMYAVPEYEGLPIIWGGGLTKGWTLAEVRHIRAQYAGEVTMVDKWVGVFLEKIEDLGLLDNTLVIFLSDHGELLGEHGIIKRMRPWPYDELSHIPLIMRPPDGTGKAQERIDSFVETPDIMPTILDFLGIKGHNLIQGRSLLPLISGEEEGTRDFAISGHYVTLGVSGTANGVSIHGLEQKHHIPGD